VLPWNNSQNGILEQFMPCGRQESNNEGSEKPKPKLKSKSRQTKSSQKRRTLKNSYPNFDNLHPDVKKNMNKLQDLYSHIINNFASLKSNMPNIFDTDLMARTFSETHQVMVDTYVEKPQVWDAKQKNYLGNLDKLYKRMIDRLQGIEVEPIITPKKNDKRFKSAEWEEFPAFDYLKQSYLLHSNYINDLIESLDEIDPKTKEKAKFYVRNFMDAISPTNSPFTNPEVMKETIRTQGKNLVEGYQKLLNDNENSNFMSLPMFTDFENFDVGENLATTEGKVVFETPLFQLLYYKPTTELVHERPLLMIPPWINKFYIFDLQKDNSFVQWALDKGLSVFIISWINPDKAFAKFGFEEYVLEGALLAVEKVLEITSQKKLNLLAYCTGGVAATILAAYLAKKPKNNPIESISLLAAPINFEKMGDLKVFICDEQIISLEKRLKKIGYFPGDEMVRVFSLLSVNHHDY
jgi:polyhydroxyalkanoate synthase